MYLSIYKQTLFGLLLFVEFLSPAQNSFNLTIEKDSLTLEGKNVTGYKTIFDFPRAEGLVGVCAEVRENSEHENVLQGDRPGIRNGWECGCRSFL